MKRNQKNGKIDQRYLSSPIVVDVKSSTEHSGKSVEDGSLDEYRSLGGDDVVSLGDINLVVPFSTT
jgi:hypothetical protein